MLLSNFQKSPIAEDQLEQKADFAGGEFPTTVYHQTGRLKKIPNLLEQLSLDVLWIFYFRKVKTCDVAVRRKLRSIPDKIIFLQKYFRK